MCLFVCLYLPIYLIIDRSRRQEAIIQHRVDTGLMLPGEGSAAICSVSPCALIWPPITPTMLYTPLSLLSASLTLAITRAEDMCSYMFTLFTSSHQPYIRHQIHEETIRLSTILILCTWPPQSGLEYSERNASDVE